MSTQQTPSMFAAFATTFTGLLSTVNTTANLLNRTVNTVDQYAQTVERHATDYNFKSQVISAKRREQLSEEYKLLSPEQKQAMSQVNPFDSLPT
jgi:hypothetical protein